MQCWERNRTAHRRFRGPLLCLVSLLISHRSDTEAVHQPSQQLGPVRPPQGRCGPEAVENRFARFGLGVVARVGFPDALHFELHSGEARSVCLRRGDDMVRRDAGRVRRFCTHRVFHNLHVRFNLYHMIFNLGFVGICILKAKPVL